MSNKEQFNLLMDASDACIDQAANAKTISDKVELILKAITLARSAIRYLPH